MFSRIAYFYIIFVSKHTEKYVCIHFSILFKNKIKTLIKFLRYISPKISKLNESPFHVDKHLLKIQFYGNLIKPHSIIV